MLSTVDLFSGCGGMSLGFEKAGFDINAAFENWSSAVECYKANFSHPIFSVDLSNRREAIDRIRQFSPQVIIGGPPCQDFSHAGKRIEAERASLTEDFAYIVAEIKPLAFVMENVDRAQNSISYKKARETLLAANYGLSEVVLDASLCGVPQKRKRFFCVGFIDKPMGYVLSQLQSGLSNNAMTVREYLGDTLGLEYYYRHPRNYSRRGVFSIDEPAPTVRGVNRPIPKGYPGHDNDPIAIDDSVRPLTTQERALLQTFPRSFKLIGTKTDLEQMIGNAVPVELAYYVAQIVKEKLHDQ